MREHAHDGMSLYGPTGGRKYLNATERPRFIKAPQRADPETRLFCPVLGWSGARISEGLALTSAAVNRRPTLTPIPTLQQVAAALAELGFSGENDRRPIGTPPISNKDLINQPLAIHLMGVKVGRRFTPWRFSAAGCPTAW